MLLSLNGLRLLAARPAGAALAAVLLCGCGQQEQIARYTVPKPELVDPTLVARSAPAADQVETRTLGLIVPVGETGWFFKLTGEAAAVEPQNAAFLQFVMSLKFSGGPDAKPSWTLPEGWKEQPGSGMRYATIQVPGEGKSLDLSIIPLPKSGGDTTKYVLDNVNRWRDQLKLKPLAAEDLPGAVKTLKVGEHEATLVSMIGTGSGGMGGAPFAPFAGGGALPPNQPPPSKSAASKAPASAPGGGPVSFTAPPEWSAGPRNAFSVAAFKATEGDKQVDITISSAGGDWLANVNRWRGQIGLAPTDAAELGQATRRIEAFGSQGEYVELIGPAGPRRETILGVRVDAGGQSWFVKLKGDAQLASREKDRFESFVKSLQLP